MPILSKTYLATAGTLAVAALALCTGCRSKSDISATVSETVEVDVENLSDNADDFFSGYDYCILETTDDALIGEIDRIDTDGRHIAIASGDDIFIYEKSGKLRRHFNNFGQGPKEYQELTDLRLRGDEVLVLSRSTNAIKVYSLDGTFRDTYKLPDYYGAMLVDGSHVWLASESSNGTGFEFACYDTATQEVTRQVMPFEKNQSCISSAFSPFLWSDSEEILVGKQFDTTVYAIGKDSGEVSGRWLYHFNTPMQLSDFDLSLPFAELYQATANKPLVTMPGLICETKDWIYQNLRVFFRIGFFPNIYRFSRENPTAPGKMLRIGLMSFESFPYLRTQPIAIQGNSYVSAMDAGNVLSIAESIGSTEFSGKGVTPDSNPILFFHHFR